MVKKRGFEKMGYTLPIDIDELNEAIDASRAEQLEPDTIIIAISASHAPKIYEFNPQGSEAFEQLLKDGYIKRIMNYDGMNSRSLFNGEYYAQGYTKLNSLLFDCLYASDLSRSELVVFLYIIRHTTGYHKTTCIRNISMIAKKTNMDRKYVYKGLKGLKDKRMIFEILIDGQKLIRINFIPTTWVDVNMAFDFEAEFIRLEEKSIEKDKKKKEGHSAKKQKNVPRKAWSDEMSNL